MLVMISITRLYCNLLEKHCCIYPWEFLRLVLICNVLVLHHTSSLIKASIKRIHKTVFKQYLPNILSQLLLILFLEDSKNVLFFGRNIDFQKFPLTTLFFQFILQIQLCFSCFYPVKLGVTEKDKVIRLLYSNKA